MQHQNKSFTDVRVESLSFFFEYFLEKHWRTTPRPQPFVSPPDPSCLVALCVQSGARGCVSTVVFQALAVRLPSSPPPLPSLSVTEPSSLWPRSNHFIWNKPLLLSKKHVEPSFFPKFFSTKVIIMNNGVTGWLPLSMCTRKRPCTQLLKIWAHWVSEVFMLNVFCNFSARCVNSQDCGKF